MQQVSKNLIFSSHNQNFSMFPYVVFTNVKLVVSSPFLNHWFNQFSLLIQLRALANATVKGCANVFDPAPYFNVPYKT